MPKATVRHILVEDREKCAALKSQLDAGADFAELARQHSDCPSGDNGGELGEFDKGMMVKEFDEVVFSAELHKVHGPVQTQFGYHLIEITSRTD